MNSPAAPSEPARGPGPRPGSALSRLRRCWCYVRPHRWWMIGACATALGSTLAGLAIPTVLQRIVDGPLAHSDTGALPGQVAVLGLLGLAEAVLLGARRVLVIRPTTRLETDMREDFQRHVLRLPLSFHHRVNSGQLLSRAVSDIAEIGRFMAFSAVFLVVNVLTLVAGLGVLAWLDPWLALIVFVTYTPMILVTTAFEDRFRVVSRLAQDQAGEITGHVEESVLGIRVVKAFGGGGATVRRFTALAEALRRSELRKLSLTAALWCAITALPETAVALLLAVGGHGVADGGLSLGTLVAAVTVATYLRWPADTLGWLFADAGTAATASDRYWEVRDTTVTTREPDRPEPLPRPARGRLVLKDVTYRHPGTTTDALHGVSLTVEPGTTLALTGPTGSGKSTLLSLLPRLADPTSGRITLDGVDLPRLSLAELRSAVVPVFDDPLLFAGTVRENVTLGAPDGLRTDEEQVRRALRVAHADGFVSALPQGLDTPLGEEGMALSGGQRQRLSLARGVLAAPALLVLDDPLSALDVHTEREVEEALREVLGRVTTIIVAHKPSTLRLADRIAYCAGGRVTAVGTHEQLLRECPSYAAMVTPVDTPVSTARVAPAGAPITGSHPAPLRQQSAARPESETSTS